MHGQVRRLEVDALHSLSNRVCCIDVRLHTHLVIRFKPATRPALVRPPWVER